MRYGTLGFTPDLSSISALFKNHLLKAFDLSTLYKMGARFFAVKE